jgi:6-phosphofructokinase
VIAVPCTIDNNVGHHMLEQSVGFDSAAKVYSQLVGNIMIDSASAVKYWYFMRLMGRDPSHLVILAYILGVRVRVAN